MENYVCSICGKKHVKLWRPYMYTSPLVCAVCAEQRQSPRKYDEMLWKEEGDHYVGTSTGKTLPLDAWHVDEKGRVPSYDGPGPKELPKEMTDQLIVNLKDVSKSYTSGETTIVPAIPDEYGEFWGYTSVPAEHVKWWEELPTR